MLMCIFQLEYASNYTRLRRLRWSASRSVLGSFVKCLGMRDSIGLYTGYIRARRECTMGDLGVRQRLALAKGFKESK